MAGRRRWWGARLRPTLATAAPFAGLGAVMATGQAPLGWWWATLPALAAALWLLPLAATPRAVAGRAFALGLGYFALALGWIVHPFFVEPWVHGWMAPFALAAMAAGMALFWGAAGWLAAVLSAGRVRLVALVVTLTGAEMLRGWLFGGFPWAMPGHAWVGTPVAQLAALAGAPGLTALTLALAAAPLLVAAPLARAGAAAAALAVLSAVWATGAARLAEPLPDAEAPVALRLVQPNAPQHLKWHPDHMWRFFERQLDLTAAAPAPGDPRPDLVIWPETSVPFLLDNPGAGLDAIARAGGSAQVALGVQRMEDGGYFNSIAVLDPDGAVRALYDKHHLVPFGEYVPFAEALLGRDYGGFAARQLQGYSPGPGPVVLDLGALGRVLPQICYETIFARHMRVTPRPDWVMQVTNDAWFGTRSGPHQHLAQARLRAIEQGLPVVRAANTGISAVIDARGGIADALALGEAGFVDAPLPGALPATVYARAGDAPLAVGLLLGLLVVWRTGPVWGRRPRPGRGAS